MAAAALASLTGILKQPTGAIYAPVKGRMLMKVLRLHVDQVMQEMQKPLGLPSESLVLLLQGADSVLQQTVSDSDLSEQLLEKCSNMVCIRADSAALAT